MKKQIIIILNNIRSNENVGSIFRTADAVGVLKIILSGYTPAPVDRFDRENKRLVKASLGAEKFVEWGKEKNLKEAINNLKNYFSKHAPSGNLAIIAVEQDKKAVDYGALKIKILESKIQNLILVFGNEVDGLSKEELKLCNIIAQIPMHGKKESLNVAVAAGIILFELSK